MRSRRTVLIQAFRDPKNLALESRYNIIQFLRSSDACQANILIYYGSILTRPTLTLSNKIMNVDKLKDLICSVMV